MPSSVHVEGLYDDLYLLKYHKHDDARGGLTKIFHTNDFIHNSIEFNVAESFMSTSKAGVLRGMHFQKGASAHKKLVYCLSGRILDVVVDIRPESDNFNRPFSIELSGDNGIGILIGEQYAHGFLSLENDTRLLYMTSTVYCPSQDAGILWSSIDYRWPISEPLLSARDRAHPPIIV
jgi:dTDP-4-dehydrorhamnose 3,5-epimerase